MPFRVQWRSECAQRNGTASPAFVDGIWTGTGCHEEATRRPPVIKHKWKSCQI
jgi:hypothetical protein